MNIHVFDLDDTILMHKQFRYGLDYDLIKYDTNIDLFLSNLDGPKYIYTNGTFGHADKSLQMMNLSHHFKTIYARDTLDSMKPEYLSLKQVYLDILKQNNLSYYDPHTVYFYDDQLVNLNTAKQFGWKTIWIHPNYKDKYIFVDHSSHSIIHS